MRLLIVEDDFAIAEPLLAGLRHHGFDAVHVARGADAIGAINSEEFDVVLLDLGLPDIDGLDVCREIRKLTSIPIIMVTARDEEIDRIVGLELGADDYVAKPFGIRELIARVRAVRRRFDTVAELANNAAANSPQATGSAEPATGATTETKTETNSETTTKTATGAATAARPATSTTLVFGKLEIDHRTHRVHVDGVEIALTPKEFGLLSVLGVDPGAVVTRMSIIEQVWDEHWYGPTKTLDVHVAQLRQKLGNPGWIETVRGVGYRLADPEAVDSSSGHSDSAS